MQTSGSSNQSVGQIPQDDIIPNFLGSSESSVIELWHQALANYKTQTGVDITNGTHESISVLFDGNKSGSSLAVDLERFVEIQRPTAPEKWQRVRKSIEIILNVSLVFNELAGEITQLFIPFGKAIFVGIGLLLKAARDIAKTGDTLHQLLSGLTSFLSRLEIRSKRDMRPGSRQIAVEILSELVNFLAIVTVTMKNKPLDKVKAMMKKLLFNESELVPVLARLKVLTENEALMVLTEVQDELRAFRPSLKDLMKDYYSPGAAFDSQVRSNPPRCAKSTRDKVTKEIKDWINDPSPHASLFWLHGGLGAGKSALAQSVAEYSSTEGKLAASFFFFRSDPSRNKAVSLIPTLISQLVIVFNGLGAIVENRIRNEDVLTKTYEVQIRQLFLEPFNSLRRGANNDTRRFRPLLIVVDGLDECNNSGDQRELLRVIAIAISANVYPFRFLIASRPESHIESAFEQVSELQSIKSEITSYDLSTDPDADTDIRNFVEQEFANIRNGHRIRLHLPPSWPGSEALATLVGRSSQHFIYASIVMGYIQSSNHRPDERLEVILSRQPHRPNRKPYAHLDELYSMIFEDVEESDLEKIGLVLGILYLHGIYDANLFTSNSPSFIEGLLGMRDGDLLLLLGPLRSLMVIEGDEVQMLHESFFEYLTDSSRRRHLPFNLAAVHEKVASYILEERIDINDCTLYEFSSFAHHCQHARLNDTLKTYLRSLEVPYPECVKVRRGRWDGVLDAWSTLGYSIWCIFQVMGRRDFDQGHNHQDYAIKWTIYLQSTDQLPWHNWERPREPCHSWLFFPLDIYNCQLSRSAATNMDAANFLVHWHAVSILKDDLETLLQEWSFNQSDITVHSLSLVERENAVLSTYLKTLCISDRVFSSLIVGNYFFQIYHVGLWDNVPFLHLLTFSKLDHSNYGAISLYGSGVRFTTSTITTIREHLKSIEECLHEASSDFEEEELRKFAAVLRQ